MMAIYRPELTEYKIQKDEDLWIILNPKGLECKLGQLAKSRSLWFCGFLEIALGKRVKFSNIEEKTREQKESFRRRLLWIKMHQCAANLDSKSMK